jgi:hypothetical protein
LDQAGDYAAFIFQPLPLRHHRLDVEGQIEDIAERLQFTYNAIEKAHTLAVKHPTTLKVFMAPEFLYRGKGGAYIHDLINGWTKQPPGEFNLSGFDGFPGLFGYLKSFVAQNRFSDWLFVFGTAISASFPAIKKNGGWLLDSTKMGEIYNTALIQRGGELNTNDAYATRKRYISGIDFIKSQYKAKGFAGDLYDPNRTVDPADRLNLEPNESDREGSATFTINGINDGAGQPIMFGLEVCLDHAISTPRNPQPPLWANSTVYAIGKGVTGDGLLYTCGIEHTSSASPTTFTQDRINNPGRWVPYSNQWGRLRTADKYVKIQLVPSGGMVLLPQSIRLLPAAGPTPYSYAFHCDGLSTLGANSEWGAHTQIWNGANGSPVPPENKLITANSGQPVSNTSVAKVASEAMTGQIVVVAGQPSEPAAWPRAIAGSNAEGLKLIGGGATVDYGNGAGSLLTGSYPEGNSWVASAKDHLISSPSKVTAYAIYLYDRYDLWDVKMVSAKTQTRSNRPTATAKLPAGYALTGGGALVDWGGLGIMLTACCPAEKNDKGVYTGWTAMGKDHLEGDSGNATAWVFGIRPRNGVEPTPSKVSHYKYTAEDHTPTAQSLPTLEVRAPSSEVIVSGGAEVTWSGAGAGGMLTCSGLSPDQKWKAQAKDHKVPDGSLDLTMWVITRNGGLVRPIDASDLWDLGSGYVRVMQEMPLQEMPL